MRESNLRLQRVATVHGGVGVGGHCGVDTARMILVDAARMSNSVGYRRPCEKVAFFCANGGTVVVLSI